jgi:hypothetical protein
MEGGVKIVRGILDQKYPSPITVKGDPSANKRATYKRRGQYSRDNSDVHGILRGWNELNEH